MRSLRVRMILVVVLAALVPVIGISLWARSVIVNRAEEQDARRLDALIQAAERRVDERLEADRRAITRLCDDDFTIDNLKMDLAAGRFEEPESQARFVAQLPSLMRSLRLDVLTVVDANSLPPGLVLGSGHFPGRAGAQAPELLAEAEKGAAQPFVLDTRVVEDGNVESRTSVVTACSSETASARVWIIGGRLLSRAWEDLATDVESVSVEIEPTTEAVDVGSRRRAFLTFKDSDDTPQYRLLAVVDDSALKAQLAELDRGFLFGGSIALFFALLFGVFLSLRVAKPLATLEEAATRVAHGDLESTIGITGRENKSKDEVGRALTAFIRMTSDLKTTRQKLLRAERIAAWRDIARRIAHEVKNPLSPIQVAIETMQKTYRKQHPDFPEIFEESTDMILEEVRKLTRLVTEFSSFARMPSPRRRPVNLGELLRHTASVYRSDTCEVDIEIEGALTDILGDRDQLNEVFMNLVKNAIEAAKSKHGESGGRVIVGAEQVEGGIEVRIMDNGAGIPEDQRARIFEPYFTTKSTGTGLGLSIVHRIITDHGGNIEVHESKMGGAEFAMFLSESGPQAAATASMTGALPLLRRREQQERQ